MNYQKSHTSIIEKLYSMGVQEHSKYSLREILNRQDPDLISEKYLIAFHKGLTELLDQIGLPWECRTDDRGLTYLCERRAFIMLSINKDFISILFFTGNLHIKGLIKGNWSTGKDNLGCKRFRVVDDHSLSLAINFGLLSYFIADNWLDCPEPPKSIHPDKSIREHMDKEKAKKIVLNAAETTKPRWSQFGESWRNIDSVFIYRGYEQQGFQLYKLRPLLEKLHIYSIDTIGSILMNYADRQNYTREFAGSLTSEFYQNLQRGVCGREGKLFVEAIRTFLDERIGNPGRTFWKLVYQMLQGCAYLRQNYSSSFGKYILSKYAGFTNRREISEIDFLSISITEWERFLATAKPWKDLMGIGPNVFDFLFGDIAEAQFVENSYKFDSSNQHFLKVTGISKLIVPFNRATTTQFLKDLDLPYNLRQINKGIYTFCSKSESDNYGYCRDHSKCRECKVNSICAKELHSLNQTKTGKLSSVNTQSNHNMTIRTQRPTNGLPQLNHATTFEELSEIIGQRSEIFPTNYLDLLLLQNENSKVSDILARYQCYEAKNNDYKTVSRIKAHIRYRENHDGWIFNILGDPRDPIVKLIAMK